MTDLTEDSFVVIPAGQSVTATHTNIGPLYKFHGLGVGSFTFAPRQDFQVAGADSVVTDIADTLRVVSGGPTVDVHVDSDVSKRELAMERDLEKRARVTCSTSSYSSFISASLVSSLFSLDLKSDDWHRYTEGKSLAALAANYINSRGTSDSLFRAYFGATTSSKPYTVFSVSLAPFKNYRYLIVH